MKVAIIGLPNVGKSTLFNKLTKTRLALVDDKPGLTRDRKYGKAFWDDKEFELIDTGGFIKDDEDDFANSIQKQVRIAIAEADTIIVLFDGKNGVSSFDKDLIALLHNFKGRIFYLVNKIDTREKEHLVYDFYSLGIDKVYPISAEHSLGLANFLDDLFLDMKEEAICDKTTPIKVAIVGRPNVGKSSLVNKILGQERMIVSKTAGTTRDSIDTICMVNDKEYLLIDTAGIRKKSKTEGKIEKLTIIKALESLERANIALIMIDGSEGISEQDIKIASYAFDKKCACIFIVNKWDLVEDKDEKKFFEKIRDASKFLNFAPIITISALTGLRVKKIFSLIDEVYKQYSYRIKTSPLNKVIEDALAKRPPSMHKNKRLKFYYTTQIETSPPTFLSFVNYPDAVHFSYERFLINQIREKTGLDKVPIKLIFKLRTGKIDFKSLKGKRK